MNKTKKTVLSMIAAAAAVSAAVFAARKHKAGCGETAPCTEPDNGLWEDEEYFPDFEEESVPAGEDEAGAADGEEKPAAHGIYLTADETGFIRFLLEGIGTVAQLTGFRMEDIEKTLRKRKITNTDRMRDIKNTCAGWDSDRELLEQCVSDIREMLEGGFPEDFLEYMEEGEPDGGGGC